MVEAERYDLVDYLAKNPQDGKLLGEQITELILQRGESPVLVGLAIVLNKPVFPQMFEENMGFGEDEGLEEEVGLKGSEDLPNESMEQLSGLDSDVVEKINQAEEKILANEKRRDKALTKLVMALTSADRITKLGNWVERGRGTVAQIAELRAGIKRLIEVVGAPGAESVQSLVIKIEELGAAVRQMSEEMQKTTENGGLGMGNGAAETIVTQLKQMNELMNEGKVDEAEKMATMMAMGGGGTGGLTYGSPAYERYMQIKAALAIYREIAGLKPEMSSKERKRIINEMVLIFSTGQATSRYTSTLVTKALNTFDIATSTLEMFSGVGKVREILPKLMVTTSGGKEELGGMGKEMPNAQETMALFLNAAIEMRVLMRDGAEKIYKYSFCRAWDFYNGDGRKPMELSEMSLGELKNLFKQYSEVFKARYGEDFDPVRVLAKFKRMRNYRRDLPGVRQDIKGDVGLESQFAEAQRSEIRDIVKLKQRVLGGGVSVGDVNKLNTLLANVRLTLLDGVQVPDELADRVMSGSFYKVDLKKLESLLPKVGEMLESTLNNPDEADGLIDSYREVFGLLSKGKSLSSEQRILIGEFFNYARDYQTIKEEAVNEVCGKYLSALGAAIDGGVELDENQKKLIGEFFNDVGKRHDISMLNRVKRGEFLTPTEQRFVDEVLGFPAYVSQENGYLYKFGVDGELKVNAGDKIIPALLSDEEGKKLNLDVSAWPVFARRNDPLRGSSSPIVEWATRDMREFSDNGLKAYIEYEIEEAGIDLNDVVAVELTRDEMGLARKMVVSMGKRGGGVGSVEEFGLLPDGAAARLGEDNYSYIALPMKSKDKGYVLNSLNQLVPQARLDDEGRPLYEPEWEIDEKTNKPKIINGKKVEQRDFEGNIIYQVYRDDAGNTVEVDGRKVLMPKLDDEGKPMLEMMRDDKGNLVPATPGNLLVKVISAVRFAPFSDALKTLWWLGGNRKEDFLKAGENVPKGILKNHWEAYSRYYAIMAPYMLRFFRRNLDSIYARKFGASALMKSLGSEKDAHRVIMQHLDPRKDMDTEINRLEPVKIKPVVGARLDELDGINKYLKEVGCGVEGLKEAQPKVAARIREMVDQGVWVAPVESNRVFTAEEYVRTYMKDMLVVKDRLPHAVEVDDMVLNHVVGYSRWIWGKTWRQEFGGVSEDDYKNTIALNLGVKDELDNLKQIPYGKITSAQNKRRNELTELVNEAFENDSRVSRVASVSLEKTLAVGEQYANQRKTSMDLSPVDYLVSQTNAYKTLWLMSTKDAELFWNNLDATNNLRSMGLPVDKWPEFMRKGRLAMMSWVGQMSARLYDVSASDTNSQYCNYNGSEGDINQKIFVQMDTDLVKADDGEVIAMRLGVQPKEVRDIGDLVTQLMKLARGGITAEKLAKQIESLTEGIIQMWPMMSYRSSGGSTRERERLTASRVVYIMEVLFPTKKLYRPMIMHGKQVLGEFLKDNKGLDLMLDGCKVADPGQPGDNVVTLTLEKVSRNGGFRSADDVAKMVIEGLRLGEVVIPSLDSSTPISVMNPAGCAANKLHMRLNDSNGAWINEEAWVDVNMAYEHESPRFTLDKSGDMKKMEEARVAVARWILKSIGDSKVLNAKGDRVAVMKAIALETQRKLNITEELWDEKGDEKVNLN